MANDFFSRILEKMRERAAVENAVAQEANLVFTSSEDDFRSFDEDVETPEKTDDEFVDGPADWSDLPTREAIVPPACAKTRGLRVFDGVRFGRHSKRGAKTPRAKTVHRERVRG